MLQVSLSFPALMVLLAACVGPGSPTALQGESRVEAGGDVFFVTLDGNRAHVRNYGTGLNNQQRLFANAQLALVELTGCPIHNFAQREGVNTYDATLLCGA